MSRDGRFAPSPTGELHIGNLRTALLAWLFARGAGARFVVRMEDLDLVTSSRDHAARQLADLAAIGLDWDGDVVFQSTRFEHYFAAIDELIARGLTYPCYCTRKEIQVATVAPHGEDAGNTYAGTCARLTQRAQRAHESAGRRPALRLRANSVEVAFVDRQCGAVAGVVDDFVLRRNDGVPSYNVAVVVDDCAQGIGEVVRGDDLLSSTPRQLHLAAVLGLPAPSYAHVPLVLGPDGARLAKRHGAVTLRDLAGDRDQARTNRRVTPARVLQHLAASLGLSKLGEPVTPHDLLAHFEPQRLTRAPWIVSDPLD